VLEFSFSHGLPERIFCYQQAAVTVWQMPDAVYAVLSSWWWTKNRLKHVERLTQINNSRNVASCWLYSENILAMHGHTNIKFTWVKSCFLIYLKLIVNRVERTQCPNVAECGYRPSGTRFKTGSSCVCCITPWRLIFHFSLRISCRGQVQSTK